MNPGDNNQVDEPTVGVDDAYDLETPEDNRRLYKQWAATYESEFVDRHGYIYHHEAIGALADHLLTNSAVAGSGAIATLEPVLDVGCGTGIVGDVLRSLGLQHIDGLDISPEMLAEAGQRRDVDDNPIYRELAEADLTQPLAIESDRYGAIVSVGTFTHGHVGPDALAELLRVVRPGGVLCLGVNEQFYEALGFKTVVSDHQQNGRIDQWSVTQVQIYNDPPDGHDAATALALTIDVAD